MRSHEWQKSIAMTFGVRPEWDARERLLAGCNVVDGCWLYRRKTVFVGHLQLDAQRVAFAMLKGPIVETAAVVATCGNPQCCCPAHLQAVSRETRVKA